jgi:hypothetical protein
MLSVRISPSQQLLCMQMNTHPKHTNSIQTTSGYTDAVSQACVTHNIYDITSVLIYIIWLHCVQHFLYSPYISIYCLCNIYHIQLQCHMCLSLCLMIVLYSGVMPTLHIITICIYTRMLSKTLVLLCCTCVQSKRMGVMLYISL